MLGWPISTTLLLVPLRMQGERVSCCRNAFLRVLLRHQSIANAVRKPARMGNP